MHPLGIDAIGMRVMSDPFQQYKGTFPYKVDSKNRVNVVVGWRPPAGVATYLMPSYCRKSELPIIKVLTEVGLTFRLATINEHIEDAGERSEAKSDLKRILRDANINEQGKLLLQKNIAEHAGIFPETEVYLVAGDSHFEVWSKENYESVHGGLGIAPKKNKLNVF